MSCQMRGAPLYRVGETRHENGKKRVRHEVALHPLQYLEDGRFRKFSHQSAME